MATIPRGTHSYEVSHESTPPSSVHRRVAQSRGESPILRTPSPFVSAGRVKGEVGGTSGLGELGDPPTIEQMRSYCARGKSRPISANLFISKFSSSPDSKPPSSKSDSISLLEEEIRHLKKDLREKSEQIRDLKRLIRASELREMTTELRSNSEYERTLGERDREITRLAEQLSLYESKKYEEVDGEVKRLANLYVTAEGRLKAARGEIEALTEKLRDLESKHNTSHLYDIISRFQSENKALVEEVRKLQSQVAGHSNISTLEREVQEVEQMQNKLIADNERLKHELESHKEAWFRLHENLLKTASTLRDCRKDMSQLTEVIRIVRKGEGVSAALILGHVSQQAELQSIQESAEVVLEQDSKALKEDLAVLRQFLSDIYAEQSSHVCAPQ